MNEPFHPPEATTGQAAELRRQAEIRAQASIACLPEHLAATTPDSVLRMLHELQVHQIELEMQNEELRRTQRKLTASQTRYVDLYDQAPIGYCTLSEHGLILEANLTAASLLAMERGRLSERLFSRFVSKEHQDLYFSSRKQLFATGQPQTCELRLVRNDGTTFWVMLESTVVQDETGAPVSRIMLSDRTAWKQVEKKLRIKNLVFDASITANTITGLDGVITEANPAFYRIWGCSQPAEVLGKHIAGFFLDPGEARAIVTTLTEAGRWTGEFTAKRRDGSTFIAYGNATVVRDESDRVIGYQSAVMDITQRRQAEDALRATNELLARFIRDSPIFSYIKEVTATESRVLHASENFHEMVGIAGSAMVGKSMAELFPPETAAKMSADDWLVVSSGRLLELEEQFNDRSYSTLKYPMTVGQQTLLAGYTIDITERKRAEQTLREWNQTLERRVAERTSDLQLSEARFRQLGEATFEGIAITENDRLFDGNRQLGEMHGYELAEMIGRPVADFVAPESRALIAERMQTAADATYEYIGLRKDGSTFPGEAHGRIFVWQGKKTRVTALRDLTAVKQAAARLRSQQTVLEHAQRLALVSEVSAGIIHQIGQPMCAMGANLAVVLAKLNSCASQACGTLEILRDVEANMHSMRDSVIHLRALAHPEQTDRVPIDCNDLVESVFRLLQQEAMMRKVQLAVTLGHNLPPVLADAVQLSQVILNLAHNAFDACDAAPPGPRTVTITTTRVDTGIELSVHDTGGGISPEAMDQLFAPFFTTKTEGLGIGLRLSQTIVEAHGGNIKGHNNANGVGATFRVILPAKWQASDATSSSPPESSI